MAVDTALYIGSFDTAKPAGSDPASELDNSDRQIKTAAKNTFSNCTGPVTASHTELSYVTGVTSAIQTQLDSKGAITGQTWTGAHDFTGGSVAVPNVTAGDNTTKSANTAYVMAAVAAATGGTGLLTLTASNAASVSLVNGQHDAGTYSSGAITWTLPATPSAGHTVAMTPCNGRIDNVVARNGNRIMGLLEDMTINSPYVTVTLRYVNSTVGWRLA